MIRLQIVEKSGANLFSTLKRAMRSKELQTFSLAKGGRRVVHVNYPGWMNWSATPGAITCEIMNPREPGTEWRLLHAFIGRLADRYAGLIYGVSIAFPDAGGGAAPARARRGKRVKRARAAKRAGRAKVKRRVKAVRRVKRPRPKSRMRRVARRAKPKRTRARRARVTKRVAKRPAKRAARRMARRAAKRPTRRARKPRRARAGARIRSRRRARARRKR